MTWMLSDGGGCCFVHDDDGTAAAVPNVSNGPAESVKAVELL